MWDFERGRVYDRRADIHAKFGGQRQSGIITPVKHKLIIVISGASGHLHGYFDRWRGDGVFEYYGQGQTGDMKFVRGNRAIRDHQKEGRHILLFEKTFDGVKFEGEMVYAGHHPEQARDSKGAMREAIVFELRPTAK